MKKLHEAIQKYEETDKLASKLMTFQPNATVIGEPFYALMQHDNGILNNKYFTLDGPKGRPAIIFLENREKAERFMSIHFETSPVKNIYYLRGITKEHLDTLVRFGEVNDIWASLLDDDAISDPRKPLKVRFLEIHKLLKLTKPKGFSIFDIFKR